MKRALVISGGGSKGAWGAGFIACKIKQFGYTWDEYYGTSTGALVATLASTGDAHLMKEAFTTMGNNDIWSKNPFRKNGKIKIFNLARKILFAKESLGSTKNLRKNLERFYPENVFEDVKYDKNVIACVSNYTDGGVSYGRNDAHNYKTFLDYVWASTCVPVVCEGAVIDGDLCQDGGLLMNIPIQRAIDNGCDEIDVVILQTKPNSNPDHWKGENMIDIVGRSVSLMMESITNYSVLVPQLNAKAKKVKLRLRYLPQPLTETSAEVLNFDPKQMSEWFDDAYEYAKIENTSEKYKL